MGLRCLVGAGLLAVIFAVPAFGQHQIVLKNGNQVVGDFQSSTLKLKTSVGMVDVPVQEISAISGNSITLGDGTALTGSIVDRSFGIQTRFGLVTIQSQDVKSITSTAPPGAGGSRSGAQMAARPSSTITEGKVGAQRNQGSRMSPTTVTSRIGQTVAQTQADEAVGKKIRVAIRRFENKTAIGSQGQFNIGTGMLDMLTTALVNTGRFIVLEREQMNDVMQEQNFGATGRVRGNTAARIGDVEGAELLIYGAVTDYMADQTGIQASAGHSAGTSIGALFGPVGMIVGAVVGGLAAGASASKAHVAIDLRLVDANTGRVVSATTVQGSPRSVGMEISFGAFGGAGFNKTPIGLAIRDCINNAVDWMLITSFPDEKEKFMAAAAARTAVGQKPGADPASATDGIAAIDDVNAVPGLDELGRESYRKWLQANLPRAFVIHTSGGWHFAAGTNPANPEEPADPSQRAMMNCEKRGSGECKLYAVDNDVVWNPPQQTDGGSQDGNADKSKPTGGGFFSRFLSGDRK